MNRVQEGHGTPAHWVLVKKTPVSDECVPACVAAAPVCLFRCTINPSSFTDKGSAMPAPEFEFTNRQIDQPVYQLYGLTDEEIKIVEGST